MICTKRIVFGAVFTALIIIFQFFSAFWGNQLLTGSLVNMVLSLVALRLDLRTAICVSMISPLAAFMLGIGPKIPIFIPFIMIANGIFVVCIYYAEKFNYAKNMKLIMFGISASILKCVVLFFSFRLILPLFISLNEKQIASTGTLFSFIAFIACVIGFFFSLMIKDIIPSMRED